MLRPDFSTLPKNPIKQKRDAADLNIAKLSRNAEVSTQVIRDLEIGLPKTIPFQLLKFFDSLSPNNILDEQYNNWRQIKRSLVFLPPVGLLSISSDKHPFTQYRNTMDVSIAALCEYLCIPRFVIMHYEENQKRMPRLLRDVLPQAHLSTHDVDRLSRLGEIFYCNKEMQKNYEQQQAHR